MFGKWAVSALALTFFLGLSSSAPLEALPSNITPNSELSRRHVFAPATSDALIRLVVKANCRNLARIDFCPSDSVPTSFYHATNQDLIYGLKPEFGLTGCTVLVAFNANGIHIAHYWENPGFSSDAHFKTGVLDFMENGGPVTTEKGKRMGPFPSLFRQQEFHDHPPNIHILTVARSAGEKSPNYPAKVRLLKETIEKNFSVGVIKKEHYYYVADDESPASLSLEFDHATKHIRVLLAGPRPKKMVDEPISA